MRRSIEFSAVGLLVLACGGEGTDEPGGGGSAGTSAGSGGGGAAGAAGASGASAGGVGGASGAGSEAACPDQAVVDGSPCTAPWPSSTRISGVAAHCTWGDDPRPECRTRAVCEQGSWRVTVPVASCSDPLLPLGCAATPPDDGVECGEAGQRCWYADGTRCSCSECEGGAAYPLCQPIDPPEWKCVRAADGCPAVQPQAGADCTNDGAYCAFDCELPIVCANDVWQWGIENCPICAAADTPIATPDGERPISELKAGDPVYSVDEWGVVVVPILRVGSAPVSSHSMIRVVFDGGRAIEMSPAHPTAGGVPFSRLVAGERLDDLHTIASVEMRPYRQSRTYDILPASSTGTYFAAGALVGSTLAPPRRWGSDARPAIE
jgi:hypothetical protein